MKRSRAQPPECSSLLLAPLAAGPLARPLLNPSHYDACVQSVGNIFPDLVRTLIESYPNTRDDRLNPILLVRTPRNARSKRPPSGPSSLTPGATGGSDSSNIVKPAGTAETSSLNHNASGGTMFRAAHLSSPLSLTLAFTVTAALHRPSPADREETV